MKTFIIKFSKTRVLKLEEKKNVEKIKAKGKIHKNFFCSLKNVHYSFRQCFFYFSSLFFIILTCIVFCLIEKCIPTNCKNKNIQLSLASHRKCHSSRFFFNSLGSANNGLNFSSLLNEITWSVKVYVTYNANNICVSVCKTMLPFTLYT